MIQRLNPRGLCVRERNKFNGVICVSNPCKMTGAERVRGCEEQRIIQQWSGEDNEKEKPNELSLSV